MKALICGSLAYDTIMVFQDQFKNHILPDKVHILNVSFLVPRMRKEFGGCAGNISYNLKLLGGHPVPMGTVGQDFGPYREHFTRCGIDLSQVKPIDDLYTAQAFITTDLDDNQITAFHPGRDDAQLREPRARRAGRDVRHRRAGRARSDAAARRPSSRERDIPFIFDPGQAMPLFNGDGVPRLHRAGAVRHASTTTSRTCCSSAPAGAKTIIASRVKAYVVTRGPKGSQINTTEGNLHIPPAHERRVSDPTGCGDAYRAGLIYGLMQRHGLDTVGRMASLMGALKVEHPGTQNQRFTLRRIRRPVPAAVRLRARLRRSVDSFDG